MSIVKLARPEIQALVAYQAAAQVSDTVRLNANEVPQSFSETQYRRPLNRYPEVRPQALQKLLAGHFDCQPDQLLVTRGSSEAIDLIIRAFCAAGRHSIVMPAPSFSMYSHYAEVQGAGVITVETSRAEDFRIDVDALLNACDESVRVVFACSPNNPTGTVIARNDLQRLVAGCADRAVVVIDEAYVEFSQQESMVTELDNYPNLLVLRTLSKALGFAGARCGCVVGARDVIELLDAVQAPYAIATPVVECVEDALDSKSLAAATRVVAAIVEERERMSAAIGEFKFVEKVWPSDANFFLIRANDADRVTKYCSDQGILLRQFGGTLSDCVRITVGSPAENDQLLATLVAYSGQIHG